MSSLSKKKGICMLSTVHLALDDRIFHKEAKSLAQAGYDVKVIGQHPTAENVDGITIIVLSQPSNRLQRMFALNWRVLRLARTLRAEVYHFHDPELIPVAVMLKILSLGRAKIVYDVHENYPEAVLRKQWIPPFLRRLISFLIAGVERTSAIVFDGIVPATDTIARRFPSAKVAVVKNYALSPKDTEDQPHVDRKSPPAVIYVGGLARERGAVEMTRSMALLNGTWSDVRLDLFGAFDTPEFEEEVRSLPGFSRINYHGWVPFTEIPARLATATIGLVLLHPVPGYPESLPVKLFEYMAAGLPVITSDFAMWREIVEGNNCGLMIPSMNPEALATAIAYLLERPDLQKEMGNNGRKAFQEKYNWERQADELLTLYSRLTAGVK